MEVDLVLVELGGSCEGLLAPVKGTFEINVAVVGGRHEALSMLDSLVSVEGVTAVKRETTVGVFAGVKFLS